MSIALMTAVWRMDIPTSDKMVLLALADAANDDGVTWMALESKEGVKLDLLKKTSLSRRAVQGALKRLCDAGYLSRTDRPGKGVIWTVRGCTSCTPQQMHPSNGRGAAGAPGGAAGAPKPSTNPLPTSEAKASSVARATTGAAADLAVSKPLPPKAQARSRFVPDDWRPSAAHIAKAAEAGVDLAAQAELFRLHEFKDPKSDFDLAFHRWLRNAPGFSGRPANQNRPSRPMEGYCALDQAMNGIDWDAPSEDQAA